MPILSYLPFKLLPLLNIDYYTSYQLHSQLLYNFLKVYFISLTPSSSILYIYIYIYAASGPPTCSIIQSYITSHPKEAVGQLKDTKYLILGPQPKPLISRLEGYRGRRNAARGKFRLLDSSLKCGQIRGLLQGPRLQSIYGLVAAYQRLLCNSKVVQKKERVVLYICELSAS